MNKQELINEFREIGIYSLNIFGTEIKGIPTESAICLIEQLDEPEKVKVPQCVADWIEVCKEHLTTSLYTAMNPNFMKENNQSFDLILWIKKTSNQEIFARAWIFGYEVEKEKRYFVKFKGFNPSYIILKYHPYDKTWFLGREQEYNFFRQHHTRKELEEAGFGWVFDCEGIEVEEVE
jgi:hypothetical protein